MKKLEEIEVSYDNQWQINKPWTRATYAEEKLEILRIKLNEIILALNNERYSDES